MTLYRFLDAMGDVMAEAEFDERSSAIAHAGNEEAFDEDVHRVEYLGPEGDWRWAGPLLG